MVFLEDFYKTMKEVHDTELLNAGCHKIYDMLAAPVALNLLTYSWNI